MKISYARVWRVLAIAAVICAFSSVAAASASDFSISWNDPTTPNQVGGIYELTQFGVAYTGIQLTPYTGCPSPMGLTDGGCAGFYNETGQNLGGFEITFTVPSTLNGQTVSYDSTGSPFTAFTCTDSNTGSCGTLSTGDFVTLDFTGANFPPVPPYDALYLIIQGTSSTDFPTFTAEISPVPEPSSLLLLGAGLGLLVLMGVWKKRVKLRMSAPVRARSS